MKTKQRLSQRTRNMKKVTGMLRTKNKLKNDRKKPGYTGNYVSIGVEPIYLDDMKIKQKLSQ